MKHTFNYWQKKGLSYYDKKEYEKAIECFDKILFKVGSPYYFKARCLYQLGKYSEATEYFDKAVEYNPMESLFWAERAHNLYELNFVGKSIDSIKIALLLDEHNKDNLIWLGSVYYICNQYNDALNIYNQIIEIYPDEADAWECKGEMLDYLERYDEALEAYDKAIQLNPKDDFAWNNKGSLLDKKKRYDEAIACFERAFVLNSENYIAWSNIGNVLAHQGKYEEALIHCNQVLAINPNCHEAFFFKGYAYYELKKYRQSTECYDKALQIYSEDYRTWYYKARSLYKLKRYHESIGCIDKSINISSEFKDSGLILKAECFIMLNQFEKAKDYFIQSGKDTDYIISKMDDDNKETAKELLKD
jgi:tetratricopeptide (TPR) repeat protein